MWRGCQGEKALFLPLELCDAFVEKDERFLNSIRALDFRYRNAGVDKCSGAKDRREIGYGIVAVVTTGPSRFGNCATRMQVTHGPHGAACDCSDF